MVVILAVLGVLGVVAVCVTLVTRWSLEFAKARVEAAEEPIKEEEDRDPAVRSVAHLAGWDEIVFEGRRYRKCLNSLDSLYSHVSLGWLRYPEGTPLTSNEWLNVYKEYERRISIDETSRIAVAARRAWDKTPQKRVEDEAEQKLDSAIDEIDEALRREEELDRRVEEAPPETAR